MGLTGTCPLRPPCPGGVGPGMVRFYVHKGECPYMVKSNASWVMVTWHPPVDRQIRLKTLSSHNTSFSGDKNSADGLRSRMSSTDFLDLHINDITYP